MFAMLAMTMQLRPPRTVYEKIFCRERRPRHGYVRRNTR